MDCDCIHLGKPIKDSLHDYPCNLEEDAENYCLKIKYCRWPRCCVVPKAEPFLQTLIPNTFWGLGRICKIYILTTSVCHSPVLISADTGVVAWGRLCARVLSITATVKRKHVLLTWRRIAMNITYADWARWRASGREQLISFIEFGREAKSGSGQVVLLSLPKNADCILITSLPAQEILNTITIEYIWPIYIDTSIYGYTHDIL